MTDHRRDPDASLAQVQADEAKAQRGRLKISFGASAGVDKTWAMLAAARAAQAAGTPLVGGVVETHGRGETEATARDLPRLPLKAEGSALPRPVLKVFDLDAALAFGEEHAEGLVLLDELAHSNAPGSLPEALAGRGGTAERGHRRLVEMNVQHLEGLNDVVSASPASASGTRCPTACSTRPTRWWWTCRPTNCSRG